MAENSDNNNSGIVDRIYRSVDRLERRLGIPGPENVTTIYKYPTDEEEPSLWIEQLTKKNVGETYKPWFYRNPAQPSEIKTIPASNVANVIHFLPPQAINAIRRASEEDS